MVKLGQKVVDTITGFEGIAVSCCEYISGIIEYGVRPRAKDGTRPDVYYIDECSLVSIDDTEEVKR